MEAVLIEVAIAVLGIIASTAISEEQMKSSEARTARETFVRHIYQAVKDRFNISIDQLNQAADRLGIKLSQLSESSRGSARLSVASKLLREFTQKYPEYMDAINQTKNVIQNEVNNLSAKENAAAAQIEQRQDYSNNQVLKDAVGSISTVSSAINSLNQKGGGSGTNQIDTTLIEKSLKGDKTSQALAEENRRNQEAEKPQWQQKVEENPIYQELTKPDIKIRNKIGAKP